MWTQIHENEALVTQTTWTLIAVTMLDDGSCFLMLTRPVVTEVRGFWVWGTAHLTAHLPVEGHYTHWENYPPRGQWFEAPRPRRRRRRRL